MVNWAPLAAIARGVLLSNLLKKLSILRKINFFLKKKWKKFAHVKKKQYLCTRFRKGNKSKRSCTWDKTLKLPNWSEVQWQLRIIGRGTERSPNKEAAHLKGTKERRWTGSSRTPSTVVSGRLTNGGMATLQPTRPKLSRMGMR